MTDAGVEQRRASEPSDDSPDPDQIQTRVDGRINEVVYAAPEHPPKPPREHPKLSEGIRSGGGSVADSSEGSVGSETHDGH